MTATNHTEHYGLSQYTESDRPTYTGDYNGDMSKIDAAIYAASQKGGGIPAVEHTADLTGDGTADNPLGVADTIARTEDIPSLDGYATTESVTSAIAAAIADRLTAGDIKSGNGINIETSGNQVTISYVGGSSSGGLTAVVHDSTLTGDGTSNSPLGVELVPIEKGGTGASDAKRAGIKLFKGNIDASGNALTDTTKVLIYQSSARDPQSVFAYKLGTSVWEYIRSKIETTYPNITQIASIAAKVQEIETATPPPATGLTATQLDTQYSDNYNIVRAGTPTRNTETEESSQ